MKRITEQFIKDKQPCNDALAWGREQGLIGKPADVVMDALIKADKLDWANWLIVRVLPYKGYVSYAVFAAEQVIDIFEKKHPNDKRPREAIDAAKECIKNPTEKNKKTASAAAYAAYAAYASSAASAAAYAAAYAASSVAYASSPASAASSVAYASSAASAAAYAAYASSAASAAARKEMKLRILSYGLTLLRTNT